MLPVEVEKVVPLPQRLLRKTTENKVWLILIKQLCAFIIEYWAKQGILSPTLVTS